MGSYHPHLIGLPSSPLATFSFDDVLYYSVGHLKSVGEQFGLYGRVAELECVGSDSDSNS